MDIVAQLAELAFAGRLRRLSERLAKDPSGGGISTPYDCHETGFNRTTISHKKKESFMKLNARSLMDCGVSRRKTLGGMGCFIVMALLSILVSVGPAIGQQTADEPDATIDGKTRAEIIDSVTTTLNGYYVFPDVAKEMEKLLRKNLKKKKYDTLANGFAFTQVLTEDLRSVSHDLHLRVGYDPELAAEFAGSDTLTDEKKKQRREERLKEEQEDNFGFYRLERLAGNVGYLDLRYFADATRAGATAVAAMNFLTYADALIIDLRQNGGGQPSMIQLISSYFFEEEQHLNSFYIRAEDTIQQFWTPAYVQGRRIPDVDIYVLTSSRTFSAAEEFTYNLKNMERATIIGETTGGGAHPVDGHYFPNLNVRMSVPFGRAINPISGTNWEGVGVAPDIEVPQEQALITAHSEALKKLHEKATDESKRELLAWDLETLESKLNPVEVDLTTMQKYAGVYGPRSVTLENGMLYYQREERPKYKMIPINQELFCFDELDYFRLLFVSDEQGQITEVTGLYRGGHQDHSPRTGK